MDDSQTTLTLGFLVIPFLVTLILTGIHVYLGLHVLSRGIIFVDLALAQVAALGATFATLVDHSEIHGGTSYWWALGFTLAGAVVFAGTRRLASRVPQEAIIGIIYAVASAAVILVMDRAPHGAEHIKSLLVRDILWVQDWGVVTELAAIYGAIGAFHWLFRRRFLDATFGAPHGRSGWSVFWWDLLFYATFGAVVTSSVQVAGVLLVFSYLMVPSVMAALLVDSIGARLAVGWAVGFVVSVAGLYGSARFDLPTGATVVVTFGGALVLVGVALGIRRLARGRA
jgi:zinc/manganese transport system permease protein